MGIFDKFRKIVDDAQEEIVSAADEEIKYQEEQGYMRKNSGEPQGKPKEGK